jgi:quercetin dioxygenase-like cupin family protein
METLKPKTLFAEGDKMAVILNVEKDGKPFQMGNTDAKALVYPEMGARNVSLSYIKFRPGAEFPQHEHDNSEDVFYVVEGSGWFKEGDKLTAINKGDVIYVPVGDFHGTIAGQQGMVVIACQGPPDVKLMKGERNTDQ